MKVLGMKNEGKSIKTRLALYISLTIVVVCSVISVVYINWEWVERKSDIAEHVRWISAYTAMMAKDGLASGDKAALHGIVKTVIAAEMEQYATDTEDALGYVEVLDASGAPIVTAGTGMTDEDLAVMAARRRLVAASVVEGSWKDVLPDGCGMYGAYYPVVSNGVRLGTISAGVCDAPAKAAMAVIIQDSVLLLLAAGLMGALVGLRISGWFSRPIGELAKGAGELSSGNLEYRVELDSYREMQILASSFNTMAWSLKEKIESLDDSRRDALKLNEKLRRSYEEASETAAKLEKLNEWATDMAFSLEEANQRLKEEMVQTETIVHSIKDGIVAIDRDENILLMNPEAEELFGVRSADVKGSNVKVLVDALVDKIEEPESFLKKFMASTSSPGAESEFGITVVKPYRRVLRRHSSAIQKDDGEVIGRVVTFTDITRQKEVDDMKSNFVSTVSHELRTPLTSIKGALTLLRDTEIVDEETRREFMSIAEHNTDRLIGLITNLLDLSRMESGMVALRLARVDLNGLVAEMVRSAEISAGREGVVIDTELNADPPNVLVDRMKMEQVVANLLDNAIKFSDRGRRIKVATATEDDGVSISVEDEGPGIPPDKLDKVFEKFYQVDMSATRKVGGSGLGLAIARAVVLEHGGEINAVSPTRPDGTGTRFEVRLPSTGIPPRDSRRRTSPAVVEGGPSARSRETVLIVDDDESLLKLQRMAFEKEGYKVLTAGTGREALVLARENGPGFIFLDVQLPDLDGITVAGILKRDPATSDIPIVFATGQLDEESIRGLESGIAVIRKPFMESDLISAVRDYYR